MISIWHILVIFIVFLILFGTDKIGVFMTELAKGLKAFDRIMKDDSHKYDHSHEYDKNKYNTEDDDARRDDDARSSKRSKRYEDSF